MREKARHVQRLHKTLEDANIKVTSAISDLMGKSGRAFLSALIAGETDPEKLVELRDARLRAPRESIERPSTFHQFGSTAKQATDTTSCNARRWLPESIASRFAAMNKAKQNSM